MSIIKLNVENCQNCFKCIRECPLKAIEFKDNRTKIIISECVLCGHCVETCPKGAKYIKNNVGKVKEMIASGATVCATVAPSYAGWYGMHDFARLHAALSALGFARVEETAIGAAQVSTEYAALMQTGQMTNVIATACSSVVMLIEQHFPKLLPLLAPVASPMMAHARMMRQAYGNDIKVVFIGPCLSKMHEADDPLAGGQVDEVLTFADLDEWMAGANVAIPEQAGGESDQGIGVAEPIARIYPKQEGIIRTIGDRFYGYKPVAVDGMDRCIEMFTALQNGEAEHVFVEANICAGGCLGGPIMRTHRRSVVRSTACLNEKPEAIDASPAATTAVRVSHPRVFANRAVEQRMPTEAEIREILARTGKYTPEQELNCGSCGYATCREKAIAVFNGKADVSMCLPYLRERAESMSSMVIENSPNAIVTFDEDMNVTELNPRAEALFGVTRGEIMGQMIPALYGETAFDEAREERRPIMKKCDGRDSSVKLELTVIHIPQHQIFVAFAKDISEEERSRAELEGLRMSTVDAAQAVIDKQMRVAQEIASLLGETTAETKVVLTKLKKSIQDIS